VPTEPASPEEPYAWLAYDGLWGEKEKAPNNGPTGPNTKDRWAKPITWQEELRQASVSVPAGRTLGPSVSSAFCGSVAFAAGLFTDYLAAPFPTIVFIGVVLGLVVLLVSRTRWRPAPYEPIRARRAVGQILIASARIYARRRLRFLAIGSAFIVLSAVPTALMLLLDAILPVRIDLPFNGLSTILVSATVALVLRNLDSGRELGCLKAYRYTLRRFWSLLGAAAIAGVVQIAIAITVIGIPWAIYRFICRVFVLVEVVLNGHSARSSQGASVALVRGTWWRTAFLVGLLYLVLVAVGPVVGFVLLFTTRLSPELINVIGSVIYTIVFPYAAIAGTLLYFDLVLRRGRDQAWNQSSSGTRAASDERSPPSRISTAAAAIALTATQVKLPPTLIRWAPAATISATESSGRASTFTGLETASQTARISSPVRSPGA